MSPYVPDMQSKGLVAIGDFNNFDFNNGVMLEEENEGIYSAELTN